MKKNLFRFVSLFLMAGLILVASTPFGAQQAQVGTIDPEGEATVAYTLDYAGGDPIPNATLGAYILDDQSVVVSVSGEASVQEYKQYKIEVDLTTNTYTTTLISSGSISPSSTQYRASLALRTDRTSGQPQVKTINQLAWILTGGSLGYTCWGDKYTAFSSSVTGGLTWNIIKSPVDAPYSTLPGSANLINDTGNGKYKNFNFGDPNLSTVVLHFLRMQVNASRPGFVNYEAKPKLKGEKENKFITFLEINLNQPSFQC
jgi:hypothetical protein